MNKVDVTIESLTNTIKELALLNPSEAIGASFFVLAEDTSVKENLLNLFSR